MQLANHDPERQNQIFLNYTEAVASGYLAVIAKLSTSLPQENISRSVRQIETHLAMWQLELGKKNQINSASREYDNPEYQ